MWFRRRNTRSTSAVLGLVFVVAALAGCDDDGTGPAEDITADDLPGTYEVVTFTLTDEDGNETDLLDDGVELTITLGDDGATEGRLFVPGGDEDGGDLDAALDGTFAFDDAEDELEFDQDADTFLPDVTFTASRENGTIRLQASWTDDGFTLDVVLEKR